MADSHNKDPWLFLDVALALVVLSLIRPQYFENKVWWRDVLIEIPIAVGVILITASVRRFLWNILKPKGD